jgi:hypothetical protein
MKKALRVGKILVDWSQNDEHKTTISVYSLRARERPTVSTPLHWEEVERVLAKKDPKLVVFEADDVLKRVDEMGDLFDPVLKLKQKLPDLQDLLRTAKVEEGERVAIAAQAEERIKQMNRKAERRGPPPARPVVRKDRQLAKTPSSAVKTKSVKTGSRTAKKPKV